MTKSNLPVVTLRSLYPNATEDELQQIEEVFDRYVEFILDLINSTGLPLSTVSSAEPERECPFSRAPASSDEAE